MRSLDLEKQNKLILQKTNDVLNEWKLDYIKLIDVLKEKEKNLEIYQEEIDQKKHKIFNLEDKLISISILEKKIQFLQENFQRETQKISQKYEHKIKEIQDPYIVAPNLLKYTSEKQKEIVRKENENKKIQKELLTSLQNKQNKEKDLTLKLKKMQRETEEKDHEIIKMKEKIAEINKEIISSNQSKTFLSK